ELALVVQSPAIQHTVRRDAARVESAGTDLHEVDVADDAVRSLACVYRAVTQLTLAVRAPAERVVCRSQRARVHPARRHLPDAQILGDGDRRALRDRRTVAELTERVPPPTPQVVTLGPRTRVPQTRTDIRERDVDADAPGRETVLERAVPQLARLGEAPAVRQPVPVERARVARAHGNGGERHRAERPRRVAVAGDQTSRKKRSNGNRAHTHRNGAAS